MSLLSHSFSTLSQCVPLCVDFVYITFLLRKGNSFYAIMMLGPRIRQRRKLIISGSSKGVTVQELMSFFSYFQVCLSYVDMATYYSTELAVVKAQEFKWTQTPISLSGSFISLHAWNIVLVMNCHQRELYEAIRFF